MEKVIWFNKYGYFFYLSILFFSFTWFIMLLSPFWKILSAILFLLTNALFNIKNREKSRNIFSKFIDLLSFGIIAFFTLVYTLISVGDKVLAVQLSLLFPPLIFLGNIILNFYGMFKVRKLHLIIVSYILISFFLIILFAYIFFFVSLNEKNALYWSDKAKLNNLLDYIYFSATSYYTSSLGEIQPFGSSRLVMIIETALNYLFHVIILGFLIGNLNDNQKEPL